MPRLCVVCNKPSTTRCSRCLEAFYCGRNCQKKDWADHKDTCKTAGLVAATMFYDRHKLNGVAKGLGGQTVERLGPVMYSTDAYKQEGKPGDYVETAFASVVRFQVEVAKERASRRRQIELNGKPDNFLAYAIMSIVVPLGMGDVVDRMEKRFMAAGIRCVNYYGTDWTRAHTLSSAELLHAKVAIIDVVSNGVAGRFDGFRNNTTSILDIDKFREDIKKTGGIGDGWYVNIEWLMDAPEIPLWFYTHSIYE